MRNVNQRLNFGNFRLANNNKVEEKTRNFSSSIILSCLLVFVVVCRSIRDTSTKNKRAQDNTMKIESKPWNEFYKRFKPTFFRRVRAKLLYVGKTSTLETH